MWGKEGMIVAADRMPGQRLSDVIRAVREDGRRLGERGSWVATVEWPDDVRGEPGQPYRTQVSLPLRDVERDYPEDLEDYLNEVEEAPESLDRQKSGARGRAQVVAVEWMLFQGLGIRPSA